MMLEKMRAHAQGVVARVLVGAIIVVLALFGFGAFDLFAPGEPAVAEVDGEEIGTSLLQTEIERLRRQQPDASIDETALSTRALDALIQRRLLLTAADRADLVVADASLRDAIARQQEFQVDGKFSEDAFQALIAQNGFTARTFADYWREQQQLFRLQRGISETEFVTEADLVRTTALMEQKRDVAWLRFAADPATVVLVDAELSAYFEANRDKFVEPEQAAIDYVRLSPNDITDATLPVTDAEISEAHAAASAAALSELRVARHILLSLPADGDPAPVTAQLNALAGRVRAGESFEALSREHSQDAATRDSGGLLPPLSRGALAADDAGFSALEEALFALGKGEVSAPVRSPQGMHLLMLEEVRSQEFPALAAMRDSLTQELRTAKRNAEFAKRRDALAEDAYSDPSSLQGLADRHGLTVKTLAVVRKDGAGEGIAANAAVVAATFSAPVLVEKFNSNVVDVEGDAVVVRVREHQPERQQELVEARERVVAAFRAEQASQQADATARAALSRAEGGEALGTLATALGLTLEERKAVGRAGGDVPPEVVAEAFRMQRPTADGKSLGVASLADGGRAVIVVTRVIDGADGAIAAADRASLRGYLRAFAGQRTFSAWIDGLQAGADVKRLVGASDG